MSEIPKQHKLFLTIRCELGKPTQYIWQNRKSKNWRIHTNEWIRARRDFQNIKLHSMKCYTLSFCLNSVSIRLLLCCRAWFRSLFLVSREFSLAMSAMRVLICFSRSACSRWSCSISPDWHKHNQHTYAENDINNVFIYFLLLCLLLKVQFT